MAKHWTSDIIISVVDTRLLFLEGLKSKHTHTYIYIYIYIYIMHAVLLAEYLTASDIFPFIFANG